jgi:hypothetical protein
MFRRNLAHPSSGQHESVNYVTSSVRQLLATARVAPSPLIFVTLMKEAISSYETSVLTTVTRRKILEDAILHSHRRENLKISLLYMSQSHSKSHLGFVVPRDLVHSNFYANILHAFLNISRVWYKPHLLYLLHPLLSDYHNI